MPGRFSCFLNASALVVKGGGEEEGRGEESGSRGEGGEWEGEE